MHHFYNSSSNAVVSMQTSVRCSKRHVIENNVGDRSAILRTEAGSQKPEAGSDTVGVV